MITRIVASFFYCNAVVNTVIVCFNVSHFNKLSTPVNIVLLYTPCSNKALRQQLRHIVTKFNILFTTSINNRLTHKIVHVSAKYTALFWKWKLLK